MVGEHASMTGEAEQENMSLKKERARVEKLQVSIKEIQERISKISYDLDTNTFVSPRGQNSGRRMPLKPHQREARQARLVAEHEILLTTTKALTPQVEDYPQVAAALQAANFDPEKVFPLTQDYTLKLSEQTTEGCNNFIKAFLKHLMITKRDVAGFQLVA